jgi:hypothetical protein
MPDVVVLVNALPDARDPEGKTNKTNDEMMYGFRRQQKEQWADQQAVHLFLPANIRDFY